MWSFARYVTILEKPELKGAIAASVVGRLPIGMAGLALMLATQETTGSFATAGAITGAYIAGLAFLAPLLGRSIDRSGPRRVLAACGIAYPAMLCLLIASLRFGAPIPLAFVVAFVAGACFPPITVCMRAFLRQRLHDDALLSTSYSMESLLIESIFILGPVLVAAFVATLTAQAAVLFAAACSFAGTLMFLNSSAIRLWRIEPRKTSSLFGPLTEPGFPALLATIVCYAIAFGLVEIGVTGIANEWSRPAMAGVLLALMSVGSATGALAYGGRTWRSPLRRQFAAMLFLMGAGIAILAGVNDAWQFAFLCVFAGVVMAPALIIQSMLVAKLAKPQHSTEAFTWSSTGLLAGVSTGIALGGVILESAPASAVFVTAGLASMAAAVLAIALLRER